LLRHSSFGLTSSFVIRASSFATLAAISPYFGVVAAGLWPAWQQPMPLARRPQAGGYI
jgi:hypothetical protein